MGIFSFWAERRLAAKGKELEEVKTELEAETIMSAEDWNAEFDRLEKTLYKINEI